MAAAKGITWGAQPNVSDIWIPKPKEDEVWNGHTIHTHYFGFSIPEERIGAFIYIRYQPVFNLSSGGTCIYQGMDNLRPLDCEHCNYIMTMPYPTAKDNTIKIESGVQAEFIELGKKVRIRYESKDKETSFDILRTAITPLLPRGHVMPGEDLHTNPEHQPGGSEQFMHCTGTLKLNGTQYSIDCYPVRDRSWRQTRTEDEVAYPPVGWSPMCFGENLSFNQVGYEHPDTNPIWEKAFVIDKSKPSHYFAWVVIDGAARNIVRVRRNVTKYHPELFAAIEQDIEAEDDTGRIYHFKGSAIAMAQLPSWPNNILVDSVFRWEDDQGRISHCAYQEAWYARNQRFRRGKLNIG